MEVTGRIEKKEFGFDTWALVAEDGATYELKDPPQQLQKILPKVQIQGKIRKDLMTMAMIGPLLEIQSFQIFYY